jgi:hypothetical protein
VPWRIAGEEVIFAWLETERDATAREALLAWLPRLADDPMTIADIAVPGPRLPTFVAFVAAGSGEPLAVTYVVLGPPLRTVRVVEVERLP